MEPIKPHVSAPRRAVTGVSHSDFLPRAKPTKAQERLSRKPHAGPAGPGAPGRGPTGRAAWTPGWVRGATHVPVPQGNGVCGRESALAPRAGPQSRVRAPLSACGTQGEAGSPKSRRSPGPARRADAQGPNGVTGGPRAALLPRATSPAWGGLPQPPVSRRKKESVQSRRGEPPRQPASLGKPCHWRPPWRSGGVRQPGLSPPNQAGSKRAQGSAPRKRGESRLHRDKPRKPAEKTPKPRITTPAPAVCASEGRGDTRTSRTCSAQRGSVTRGQATPLGATEGDVGLQGG